jgi:hypothetical protein
MESTGKDFIGRINQDSFEIIESSFFIPYGALCIIKGTVNQNSTISVVTTLHKAFRVLFLGWLIVVTVTSITFLINDPGRIGGLLVIPLVMVVASILFRLFLHGMYVLARNKGLLKMKEILEVCRHVRSSKKPTFYK